MKLGEHRRVKHGELPGDISRQAKIRMREGRGNFWLFPWQHINQNAAKSYRRDISRKGRAVQRRRDQRAIEEELA